MTEPKAEASLGSMWTKLKALLAYEPAIIAWTLNGGLAALLAFVFHLGSMQEAAVTTIATAVTAGYTAYRARPIAYSVVIGAAATIATAGAAFGLHLPPEWIATGTTVLSTVLGQLFRTNLTPSISLRAQRPATQPPAAPSAAPAV